MGMKLGRQLFLMYLSDPIDAVARRIVGKQNQPPLHLRWAVGAPAVWESAAAEYVLHLRLLAGMTPSSSVLDIGCGMMPASPFLSWIFSMNRAGTKDGI